MNKKRTIEYKIKWKMIEYSSRIKVDFYWCFIFYACPILNHPGLEFEPLNQINAVFKRCLESTRIPLFQALILASPQFLLASINQFVVSPYSHWHWQSHWNYSIQLEKFSECTTCINKLNSYRQVKIDRLSVVRITQIVFVSYKLKEAK